MAELSSSQVLAQTNQAAAKINESLSKYIQCFTLDLPGPENSKDESWTTTSDAETILKSLFSITDNHILRVLYSPNYTPEDNSVVGISEYFLYGTNRDEASGKYDMRFLDSPTSQTHGVLVGDSNNHTITYGTKGNLFMVGKSARLTIYYYNIALVGD